MDFILAGLIAGIIAFIGQIIFSNTKLGPVKFFMLVISGGAILSGLGFMSLLNKLGQAGVAIMTISPGDMFYGSWISIITAGDFSTFILLISLLIGCFAAGIICGVIGKIKQPTSNVETENHVTKSAATL